VRSKRLALAVAAASIVVAAVGQVARASEPLRLRGGDPLRRLRVEERQAEGPRSATHEAALIFVALASGALLIVVIGAIQSKRPLRLAEVGAQSPEGGAQMRRKFNDRKLDSEAQEGAQPEVPVEAAPESVASEEDRQPGSFAELGEHVASVLATAREAAEQIEADALREATLLRERSEAEAARTLADAREKARELEAETARAHSEAGAAAEEIRARAEAYADEKRQEADEAAAELVARTERQARERARAAEERQHALDVNVERTEERLRKLVTGLRELAGRLDVLVGSDALADLVGPDEARPPALDEALTRQAAGAGPADAAPPVAERSSQEA
jgi:hypothetical protein